MEDSEEFRLLTLYGIRVRQNPDEITLILQARREDELEDNDTNINEDESQHSDDDYDGSDDESQVDSYSEEISSADINSYSVEVQDSDLHQSHSVSNQMQHLP